MIQYLSKAVKTTMSKIFVYHNYKSVAAFIYLERKINVLFIKFLQEEILNINELSQGQRHHQRCFQG